MKPLKSLLAVSLSAAMLFSVPVSGITGMEPQTVEAATKSCKLNRSSVTMNAGSSTRLTLSNAVSGKIVWRSSNTKIATVTNGIVKGKKGRLHIHLRSIGRKDLQMQGNNQRSQNTCTQQNLADIKSGWPVQSRIKKCSRKSNMEVL